MVERYNAAACYLTDCAETVSEGDPMYGQLKYWQDVGASLIKEQEELKATGFFGERNFQLGLVEYVFDYATGATADPTSQVPGWQALGDFSDFFTSKAEATERLMGAGQAAAGSVGAVGGASIAGAGAAG